MDLKTLIVAALLSAGLAGCHGSPEEIASRSPAALAATSDGELVTAYSISRRFRGSGNPDLRKQIEDRGLFTPEQWKTIDARLVGVGDTERVVFCAWGQPNSANDVATAAGNHRVLFYDGRRVYVDNGVVSAIGADR